MRQKTTAPLLGVAVLGRRVLNSSFNSWSGAKLFRYLIGEKGGDDTSGSPHDRRLSTGEMERRREQLNQLLQQAYREKLARRKKQGGGYARPVWTYFPTVTA